MRKWFVFLILLLFNFLFIYGIRYTNVLLFNNNVMIYLDKKDELEKETENSEEQTEIATSFDGESIEVIGKKINRLFKKTPLEDYGEEIASISISKSVNPYLIGGIILESTNCKTDCTVLLKQCNNVASFKGEPGCFGGTYKKYNSVNDSIRELVNKISNDFISVDTQAPYKMYKKYGKNETWAFKVSKYMEELKRGK